MQEQSFLVKKPGKNGMIPRVQNTLSPSRSEGLFLRRLAGMTLVELLLALLILSILAALLMPTLETSISMARRTDCLNRQRQCGLSMMLYAEQNNGRLAGEDKGRLYDYSYSAYGWSTTGIFYGGGPLINHGVWVRDGGLVFDTLFCPDISF